MFYFRHYSTDVVIYVYRILLDSRVGLDLWGSNDCALRTEQPDDVQKLFDDSGEG